MADEKPFHNPFGALASLRGTRPEPPTKADVPAATPPAPPSPAPPTRGPARAVVRMERAGRGGKEVTVVEQLGLPEGELAAWLKAMKASLGCGGAIEGGSLVLQGDHRDRLVALLTTRGVRKVTRG